MKHYGYYLELIATRYFVLAGIFFLIYYVVGRNRLLYKKLHQKLPGNKDYAREIGFSIITMGIFALVPLVLLHYPLITRHTTFYTRISHHGWWYFFAAFILMFLIHDTYFYWTHRMMHHKKIFPIFHLLHHKSTNPTPWAAYAFHPLEAVVEAGVFVVFLFTLPVHPLHLFIFFFLMILYNVYGHLGYELYPIGFAKHSIGKWINTSTYHNQHHQFFKGNYGLYFTIWDRWMGTLRKDVKEELFEGLQTQAADAT